MDTCGSAPSYGCFVSTAFALFSGSLLLVSTYPELSLPTFWLRMMALFGSARSTGWPVGKMASSEKFQGWLVRAHPLCLKRATAQSGLVSLQILAAHCATFIMGL